MSSLPVPVMVEPPSKVMAVPFFWKAPMRPPLSIVTVRPLIAIPVCP